ncbi:hypothetical protein RFI_33999 [Reticulomyxa filosa]|uniref:Uncharacterized protein n=1 Tax=Reticulomyxa filosa TaxID=46433 RepID=X6LPX6_RETFI|nr:hypothetical protein RFI_33999 [Reticulomyxa filosa]|eukprot:ETO03411.1 hypothetical protein RFI_33999 [Reticulomyxa filosa]
MESESSEQEDTTVERANVSNEEHSTIVKEQKEENAFEEIWVEAEPEAKEEAIKVEESTQKEEQQPVSNEENKEESDEEASIEKLLKINEKTLNQEVDKSKSEDQVSEKVVEKTTGNAAAIVYPESALIVKIDETNAKEVEAAQAIETKNEPQKTLTVEVVNVKVEQHIVSEEEKKEDIRPSPMVDAIEKQIENRVENNIIVNQDKLSQESQGLPLPAIEVDQYGDGDNDDNNDDEREGKANVRHQSENDLIPSAAAAAVATAPDYLQKSTSDDADKVTLIPLRDDQNKNTDGSIRTASARNLNADISVDRMLNKTVSNSKLIDPLQYITFGENPKEAVWRAQILIVISVIIFWLFAFCVAFYYINTNLIILQIGLQIFMWYYVLLNPVYWNNVWRKGKDEIHAPSSEGWFCIFIYIKYIFVCVSPWNENV